MNAPVIIEPEAQAVADPKILDDFNTIARKITEARMLFDEGDAIAAKMLASGSYDLAKALSQFARRAKALSWVDKSRRMQGDALLIEMLSKMQIAREWDAAQGIGDAAKQGRPKKNIPNENVFTQSEAGLSAKEIHEGRKLIKAEEKSPGLVQKAIEARLAQGLEPSRANLRAAVGTACATNAERGQNLYETPPEALHTLLALEKFAPTIWEPACGRGAISKIFEQAGYDVVLSDLIDYGTADRFGQVAEVMDFLATKSAPECRTDSCPDIVTNPPYGGVLNGFVAHALRVHRPKKMALLLNLNFLCGFEDEDRNFVMDETPPARVWVFKRRLPMMHRDGWDGPKAQSRMNTAWFVWERNELDDYGDQTVIRRVDWKAYLPGGDEG